MKSLKNTLSLLLALCLVFTLAACIPNQTDPTDPSTEATSPTEEASVPTEGNPTIPAETTSPATGETNTDPTTALTVPPEESTDPTDDTTAPIESGETEPTEPPIQFPISYSDSSATITITREWFEDACSPSMCQIQSLSTRYLRGLLSFLGTAWAKPDVQAWLVIEYLTGGL